MDTLRQVLDRAAGAGLVSEAQVGPLGDYLTQNGVFVSEIASAADAPEDGIIDTEAPRFVRGFHDVLITIGTIILIAGTWGVGSAFAVPPVVIVLAEILVRSQRLALPAVVLSLALAVSSAYAATWALDDSKADLHALWPILVILAPIPFAMAIFYFRYRVPVALALLFVSACAFLLFCLFDFLDWMTGPGDFVFTFPYTSSTILLASAVGLFVIAIRYDMADPFRVTRRSDIAFWLHLAAAPALLYAMFSFIVLSMPDNFGATPFAVRLEVGWLQLYESTGPVLAIVILMMIIGLIIDRRAFVTSGLISLIAVIVSVFRKAPLMGDSATFVTWLVVGAVVLAIGIGWPQLRRLLVRPLPEPLKAKLPPLR